MTNQPHSPEVEDDEAVDLDSLFNEIVLSDSDSEKEFLRTQWIEHVLNQLVSLRVSNNLTQRQLGERIGKPQSSIARLESASDMKLSVLWDYLSAIGLSPATPLHTNELTVELNSLRRDSIGSHTGLPRMPKYEFHHSALAKARASANANVGAQDFENGDQATQAPAPDDTRHKAKADTSVVAA